MFRKAAIPWILLFLCGGLTCAQADKVDEKVDDYLREQMAKQHIPGLSVAVVRDGKVALAKGYGMANVELSVPATEKTVYEIGSMTKQFTATAVLLLVEEGKLSLDDKITQYLSDLPDAWKPITVRHLLTHTSGIKGYTEVGDFLKLARNEHTKEEIIKMVSALPLEFTPGEKWNYSNTGYYLLGMIVEKASGKPYGEFLAERLFKPLGMHTTRDSDPMAIIPHRASGYMWTGTLRNGPALQPTSAFSAGFLVSTVLDLVKWDAALSTHSLLKQASLEQMWTPAKLNDGKATGYGFGWAIGDQNGHKVIEHGGGTAAFSTIITRFVDDKMTVIVLTNRSTANTGGLARGIAGQYLPALAPVAEKAVEDKDPTTTQKLKAVLTHVAEGNADPDLFTPEARAMLFPDKIKEAATFLKPLGPLQSFTLFGQREMGKNRMLRYKAVYHTASLFIVYILTEDGKIGGMGVSPE